MDDLPSKLNKELSERMDTVMARFFPNAKKRGQGWSMGDLDGNISTKGENSHGSCGIYRGRGGIYLASDKGETTNILNLIHRKLGGSWCETLNTCKEICGIRDVKRTQSKPKPRPPKINANSMRSTPVFDYWRGRGITEATMSKYKLRMLLRKDLPNTKMERWNEHYTRFVFTDTVGSHVMTKWLGLERKDGSKEIGTTYPQYATLWGWWLVDDNTKSIIITEGEGDAMSVAQMEDKVPALSVPSGASNLNFVQNDYDRLSQFERIYILFDEDEAGETNARKLAHRLGNERCFRVHLPEGMDANEFLQSKHHGDFKKYLDAADTYSPDELLTTRVLASQAVQRRAELDEALKERNFLFPKMDFKLLPKDTGILTGYIGHGKTDFSNCVMLNEMRMGEVVGIVAMDTPPDDLLGLCAWQMVGHSPNAIEIESCAEKLYESLFFVDGIETELTGKAIISHMEYLVSRHGCTRFLIDNLSEVGDIRKDDYDAQDKFVRAIDKFDKKHGTNTMIVAHALMGDNCEWKIPARRDVEGSKGMVKPIQYGLSIFRNKVKEKPDDFEEGDNTSRRIKRFLEGSDAYFSVWKQRNGFREEFEAPLRFHKTARWYAPEYDKFSSPYPIYPSEQVETGQTGERAPINSAYDDTIDAPF